jgi:hypothetical protein
MALALFVCRGCCAAVVACVDVSRCFAEHGTPCCGSPFPPGAVVMYVYVSVCLTVLQAAS